MFFRRTLAFLALAALSACSPIEYADESPVLTPPDKKMMGLEVPNSPAIREPYTTTLEVTDQNHARFGYLVRYDSPPAHATTLERTFPTGTLIVEDRDFQRIGFITPLGRAYRFTRTDPEDLGQGSLVALLPRYFEQPGLTATPIH